MTTKEALKFVGNLSAPSKMPCQSWSISAELCHVGARMAKVEGSICSRCYARRGNYLYPSTKQAHANRFAALTLDGWVDAMAQAINQTEASGYFRWFDSGDLQGAWHLAKIVEVVNKTPNIRQWLPTREYAYVAKFITEGGIVPPNLTIRLSALMFDGKAPETFARKLKVNVSGASASAFSCPASTTGNKCLTCRACWDRDTFNVTYKKH